MSWKRSVSPNYTVEKVTEYCMLGNVEQLIKALDSGIDVNTSDKELSLIHWACHDAKENTKAVILELLKRGANINQKTEVKNYY